MITTFFISYVFEILGRKLTLFISFFTTSIIFYILPYTAPNYNYLVFLRCLIGVTMSAPLCHPLIPDYIKKSSRGKAIALVGCGLVVGEVLTMGVLFNYTKSMSFYNAFKTIAIVIMAFAFFYLVAIKDPDMKNLRKGIQNKMKKKNSMTKSDNSVVYDDAFFENLSLMQKTITFTEIVMKELR